MSFSLLRKSACSSGVLGQQMLRLMTHHTLPHRPLATVISPRVSSLTLKEANKMPTLVSMRAFSTSPARLSGEKPHDHARLWIIEKATSALLVVLVPIGLLLPHKLIDCALAILISAHSFWGMEAMVVEYIRVLLFGSLIPKIAMGIVYAFSATILGGFFYLIFNDIGVCRAFWKIWKNMRKPHEEKAAGGGKPYGPENLPPCPSKPPPPPKC